MKHSIFKAEFYITNVCNLACPGCNRFNDLRFKGWQAWGDYKDVYAQWAKKLDLEKIVILGGEPTLNPTFPEWIVGLRTLWPNAGIQILTNGRGLKNNTKLYDAAKTADILIGVSMHHDSFRDELFDHIDHFLEKPYYSYNEYKDNSQNPYGGHYSIEDANRIRLEIVKQGLFQNNSIVHTPTGMTLHNSNAESAHAQCCQVEYKNYHFIRGKLYKCGPVALFPELDEQFNLELSDSDRELLNSYQPITIDALDDLGMTIDEYLGQRIPQCKFCPDHTEFHVLLPEKILSKLSKKT